MPPKKIAIIDDSPLVLAVLSRALEEAGFEVFALDSPIGVSGVVRQHQPDLILVDVAMPALGGDRLVEILRRNEVVQGARIVLHSSRDEDELRELAIQCGAAGYLQKTDDPLEFVVAVRKLLADDLGELK